MKEHVTYTDRKVSGRRRLESFWVALIYLQHKQYTYVKLLNCSKNISTMASTRSYFIILSEYLCNYLVELGFFITLSNKNPLFPCFSKVFYYIWWSTLSFLPSFLIYYLLFSFLLEFNIGMHSKRDFQ